VTVPTQEFVTGRVVALHQGVGGGGGEGGGGGGGGWRMFSPTAVEQNQCFGHGELAERARAHDT